MWCNYQIEEKYTELSCKISGEESLKEFRAKWLPGEVFYERVFSFQ